MFEVKKIRKVTRGWLVILSIPNNCGCQLNRRPFLFEQDEKPTLEEIIKRYESKS